MISPASKNTGIAITRPVIPSAHAAFSSPNFFTIVTAIVCAPPETSRIAPNMDPKPTSRAIPFNVFPIPSLTAAIISFVGIPARSPMLIAPMRIAIIACTLNLMIRTSRITRPISAARTRRVGLSTTPSDIVDLPPSIFVLVVPRKDPYHTPNRTALRFMVSFRKNSSRFDFPVFRFRQTCQAV